ncbi:MAG: carbohydrate ABC transporter substrate-binding protein [Deinococcus sp.]|nr:carbohydrate ABC transporter substrate-binding protein [Deinococcus sp.]
MARVISRRKFIKAAGVAGALAGLSPYVFSSRARAQRPQFRILQWSHFVPRYDEWFDPFARQWGEENGYEVTVDHINLAELVTRAGAEVGAQEGHDLFGFVSPPSAFEPAVLDLTDVVSEAQSRYGEIVAWARRSTYNPVTNKWFGFSDAWVPDPGDYRKSFWEPLGFPNGPDTYADLLAAAPTLRDMGHPVGIGMSQEIDSNMAGRAIIWSFGGSIQDAEGNVAINSPETIAAVEYGARLFQEGMTAEIFSWNAASNNQALIAGRASYILNSISAYRSAQKTVPEIADDVFFTPALAGPQARFASQHVIPIYVIWNFARQPDAAKAFLLNLVDHYRDAVIASELYNFPSFPGSVPDLNDLVVNDSTSNPPDKLAVLTTAPQWTTNVGHPGVANAAIGEVFDTFIIPNMFAKAARGDLSPADAVREAEAQIIPIFQKWREQGLL